MHACAQGDKESTVGHCPHVTSQSLLRRLPDEMVALARVRGERTHAHTHARMHGFHGLWVMPTQARHTAGLLGVQ